jgi:hypothetical protein
MGPRTGSKEFNMDQKSTLSRRGFLHDIVKDALNLTLEVKKNLDEGRRISETLSAFDDLPIASTYPRELFEDEARRLGIDMNAMGEKEAIRRIVSLTMDRNPSEPST